MTEPDWRSEPPWSTPRTPWEVRRPELAVGTPDPEPPPPGRRPSVLMRVVALSVVVGLLGGFLTVVGVRALADDDRSTGDAAATTTTAGAAAPAPLAVGQRSVLAGMGLTRADVTGDVALRLIPGGNEVTGQRTLDLCDATYPSEANRVGRLQLVAVADDRVQVASSEAVLYDSAGSTAQAFDELRAAARDCPPAEGRIGPPPDTAWPSTPGVERLAFDVVAEDAPDEQTRWLVVYLRRGRALLGLYLPQDTGVDAPLAGRTSPAEVTQLLAERLAALPAAVVGP